MRTQNIFNIILLVVILGSVAFWLITRPTPQEKAVVEFFNHLRLGNPERADDYIVNASFGELISSSVISDAGVNDLKNIWGDDVKYLEGIARDNIPYARGRVPFFDAQSLSTQRERSNPNVAFVKFEIDLRIKEYFDQPSIAGRIYGDAEMSRIDGSWLIKSFDITILIEGRSIEKYVNSFSY